MDSLTKHSILLVGTPISRLAYIGLLLEQAGFTIFKCRDLEQVIEFYKKRPCALVIIDDQKPTLDAVVLCQGMRQEPTMAGVPTVLLLAVDESAKLQRSQVRCDLNNILTKPILPYLLVEKVKEIVCDSKLP